MAERIRFYTDEHVSRAVIEGLRNRGLDVLSVPEAGTMGRTDEKHLERARHEGRVIVTHDSDFLRLHAAGHAHAGIAYAAQDKASIGEIIHGLMLIHDVLDAQEMEGCLEFI